MVNVTKANFILQSNDLLQHLPTATFVAIDEEMTGISLPGSGRPRKDDTPAQRYKTNKIVPERYAIIQVGVALFHENPDYDTKAEVPGPEFLVRRYNFYLFPPSSNEVTREVTLNPSSVAFLNQHNMSFDMWTKEGISFVTTDVAETMIVRYKEKRLKHAKENGVKAYDSNRRRIELTRTEDITFHARAMASLREWIDAAAVVGPAVIADDNDAPNNGDAPLEGHSFLLPPCNPFLRRALYESIEIEYPSLVLEKAGPNFPNQIRVWRMNPEEQRLREERLEREEWEELVMNIGVWRVFRAISNACRGVCEVNSVVLAQNVNHVNLLDDTRLEPSERKIPIVVHNGWMDLLFLLTHFHSHTLPDKYEDTKALIANYFPEVYDTKIVATEYCKDRIANDSTVLGILYNKVVGDDTTFDMHSRISIAEPAEDGIIGGTTLDQAHDAAYDAFMTGAVFVALYKHIQAECRDIPEVVESVAGGLKDTLSNGVAARSLLGCNKLYLMLTLYTIDLEEIELDPMSKGMSPSTTYRISDFDPSVATRDIVRCLSNLTDKDNNRVEYDIVWVNDTTFMVSARNILDEITLQYHGQIIHTALRTRFSKEDITTLEEYLRSTTDLSNKVSEDVATIGALPSRFLSAIMGLFGYRKRSLDQTLEGERSAKRQRVGY